MDVNLTISLIRGQMGAVIEKAVNVAVETVLGEMIRVVGLKFEEIKREMTAKEKENQNIRKMLAMSRCQMKTMRKYISVVSTNDSNHRLYHGHQGGISSPAGLQCRRTPSSTMPVCSKPPKPRATEPSRVARPSWERQHMHLSQAQNIVQDHLRSESQTGDFHIEDIHGSSLHKADSSSHLLIDSQGLLLETSDPIWGQNHPCFLETGHTDIPDPSSLSTSTVTDNSELSQTTGTLPFGAPSFKIKQEEAEVEIVCVKDEHAEGASTSNKFEYSNPELQQQVLEPELGVPLDLPGSFQAHQSPGTSADLGNPAFSVDPTTCISDVNPGSCETSQCTPVEKAILESQGEMDIKINHLTTLVLSLVGSRLILPPLHMDDEEGNGVLPLMSMEDLDRLEQILTDNGMMQKMVNRLSISGGQTMKKTIWRICNKVFSSHLAKQLNWCGRGDKRGIRKTNVGALIIAAAMRNNVLLAPTEAEAEKCIKDYLRLAPGRVSS